MCLLWFIPDLFCNGANVATNGETEFHHMMMDMIPDANGSTISLVDRVPFTWSQMVDLAGTNVEEWDDLGVIVMIRDLCKINRRFQCPCI